MNANANAKKPKAKHVQKDVPSLFFILSSFKSAKSKKVSDSKISASKVSLAKSSTNNGEQADDEKKDKPVDDGINCEEVLHELLSNFDPQKGRKLSIQLTPDLSQSATSANNGDPLLSPDSGWWVSPTYEEDYAQCFNVWDENIEQ